MRNLETIVVQGDLYVAGWSTDSRQLVAHLPSQEAGASRAGSTGQRRLELSQMRVFIGDMITKGFYSPKQGVHISEKPSPKQESGEGPGNAGQDAGASPAHKPPIRLDEESGQLELCGFDLASKPPAVRKLLETYIAATELISDLRTCLAALTEFSGSSTLTQTHQKELLDISVLRDLWLRSAKLIVRIPYLDNLWDKLKGLRDLEAEIAA